MKFKMQSRVDVPCPTFFQRLPKALSPAAFVKAGRQSVRLVLVLVSFMLFSAAQGPTPSAATLVGISGLAPTALTCQLPAPTSFSGEPTDFGSAFLEWSPVYGAVSYRLIVYKLDSNELVSNTVQYGTQTQIEGLQEGVTYRCTLASICSGGSTSEFIIYEDILL